jgi:phosphonate transport system substrate-binding protein
MQALRSMRKKEGKRARKAVIIIFLCLVIIAGCSQPGTAPPRKKIVIKEDNFLLIGLVPEQNIFTQMERYEPIAAYLSEKVGVRVKLIILPSYGDMVENFTAGGMDGAFLGSLTYALLHEKLGLKAVARPVGLDGASTYRGVIFSREDSGIKKAEDMKEKRFAFVDKASAAGYLLPLAYFRNHGITNYRRYLKETYFIGTHEDTIYDVLSRKADIGAAKNSVLRRLAANDPAAAGELHMIAYSPEFPEASFAVRKDLNDAVKNKLEEALLHMHDDPEGRNILQQFGATRFIVTTDEDFRPLYQYVRGLGITLSRYDYTDGK